MQKLTPGLVGQKVKEVDAAHKVIVLSSGVKLKVEVNNTTTKQVGAVAQIRKLIERGKNRAQLIAKGFNPNTVSTQLYKHSHG